MLLEEGDSRAAVQLASRAGKPIHPRYVHILGLVQDADGKVGMGLSSAEAGEVVGLAEEVEAVAEEVLAELEAETKMDEPAENKAVAPAENKAKKPAKSKAKPKKS
jgi:hypothetical protein